jgi:hypothetical protein
MTITVTVNDGIQSANQEFSIKVTEETKKRNSNGFANGGFICFTGSNYHRVGMIASSFKVGGSKGKCVATKDKFSHALIFTITNNADFEIVNRNQLKTKRLIDTIGDMTITVTVNDGIQSANQEFTLGGFDINLISVITRVFKAGGFKGKCLTAKAEFSLISDGALIAYSP